MEQKTKQIIERINKLNSKKEITDYVEREHYELKGKLSAAGTKFFDEESSFSQDIIGGQKFNGVEEVELAKSYEEANYIRRGLTKEWVFNSSDKERFETIKKRIDAILFQLNNKI